MQLNRYLQSIRSRSQKRLTFLDSAPLGATRPARSVRRTLEAEVETYLNDLQECFSSLAFWQV